MPDLALGYARAGGLYQSDLFHLACDATELSGGTNGSTVTPLVSAMGTGTLVVAGSGSASFSAGVVGNGVKFLNGGQQNTNAAYYKWTGATIGNVFNAERGEIRFYLTSSYTWAQRQALDPNRIRYVYDIYDGTGNQFVFLVNVFEGSPNRMKWTWGQNAYGTEYETPVGQEDPIFGLGVTSKWRITYDGRNHVTDQALAQLYLNDALVQSLPYTYSAPNWDGTSMAIIGAQRNPEGYFACDDQIDEFRVLRLS